MKKIMENRNILCFVAIIVLIILSINLSPKYDQYDVNRDKSVDYKDINDLKMYILRRD